MKKYIFANFKASISKLNAIMLCIVVMMSCFAFSGCSEMLDNEKQVSISGKISFNNTPLANIMVQHDENTSNTTFSNNYGIFSLKNLFPGDTVSFSSTNYRFSPCLIIVPSKDKFDFAITAFPKNLGDDDDDTNNKPTQPNLPDTNPTNPPDETETFSLLLVESTNPELTLTKTQKAKTNSKIILEAIEDENFIFDGWFEDEIVIANGKSLKTEYTLTKNATISAKFSKRKVSETPKNLSLLQKEQPFLTFSRSPILESFTLSIFVEDIEYTAFFKFENSNSDSFSNHSLICKLVSQVDHFDEKLQFFELFVSADKDTIFVDIFNFSYNGTHKIEVFQKQQNLKMSLPSQTTFTVKNQLQTVFDVCIKNNTLCFTDFCETQWANFTRTKVYDSFKYDIFFDGVLVSCLYAKDFHSLSDTNNSSSHTQSSLSTFTVRHNMFDLIQLFSPKTITIKSSAFGYFSNQITLFI